MSWVDDIKSLIPRVGSDKGRSQGRGEGRREGRGGGRREGRREGLYTKLNMLVYSLGKLCARKRK